MAQSAPLILSATVVARLEGLRTQASFTPVNMTGITERLADPKEKKRHMEQMTDQTIIIPGPFPFMVVFSIETGHPCGTARHMSVSIEREGRAPSPAAVWMIAQHLGFVDSLGACTTYPERLKGHDGIAINVVQPLDVQPGGRA